MGLTSTGETGYGLSCFGTAKLSSLETQLQGTGVWGQPSRPPTALASLCAALAEQTCPCHGAMGQGRLEQTNLCPRTHWGRSTSIFGREFKYALLLAMRKPQQQLSKSHK